MTKPTSAAPHDGERRTTFNVRVWEIRERAGARGSTWQARWKVAGRPRPVTETFRSQRAAKARHAEITTAVSKGEAFDVEMGLPLSELREQLATQDRDESQPVVLSWLQLARTWVDIRWDEQTAPGTRRAIAQRLTTASLALFDEQAPPAIEPLIGRVLVTWTFTTGTRTTPTVDGRRTENDPPEHWGDVVAWMERHSRPITDLENPDVLQHVLLALGRKRDGQPAAANTIVNRRATFDAFIGWTVRRGDLAVNPLDALSSAGRRRPRTVTQVDRRAVVNHRQALAILAAVAAIDPSLEAFFGAMYYAATRPGELHDLHVAELDLPDADQPDAWGWMTLVENNPQIGGRWHDGGERQAGPLKHRAKGDSRRAPVHPRLCALLRSHLARFGTTPDGRIFRGANSKPLRSNQLLPVFYAARAAALTTAEQASPLARHPYDLRHAAVSTWLNGGVGAAQVAEWAGHTVAMLLKVYARCIVGEDKAALRRIDAALTLTDDDQSTPGPQMLGNSDEQPGTVRNVDGAVGTETGEVRVCKGCGRSLPGSLP